MCVCDSLGLLTRTARKVKTFDVARESPETKTEFIEPDKVDGPPHFGAQCEQLDCDIQGP